MTVAGGLVLGQHLFFSQTRVGKLMRAAAQDREMARLLGINIGLMTALTFAIAAAFGGVAGILVAPVFNIDVRMGSMVGLKAFVASIIGGWGSVPGAFVGGLIIGLVETFAAAYLSSAYKDAFAFLLMIGFLLVLPRGVFGEPVSEKV
jgi:branched-chain amino acid transport system permease protein